MIRVAICDDEKKILDEVSEYLGRYARRKGLTDLEVIPFDTVGALLGAIEDGGTFDVFILDVYIGEEMGTSLARDIRKLGVESPIIFATTSVEHAPESFETGTLRYLLKPLCPEKLYEAMDAALAAVERLGRRQIKLKTEHGVESINAGHILFSEAHDHHQHVTLSDGEVIRLRVTVGELFAMLAKYGGFLRVGSPYIINLRQVKNLSRTEILLFNGRVIPVPRGKYAEIKKAFWDYHYEGQED